MEIKEIINIDTTPYRNVVIRKQSETEAKKFLNEIFEGQEVRIIDKEGNPWFVANDIGAMLGIKNIRQVLDKLNDNEKAVYNVYTLGGNQNTTIISESGMYKIVFTSRKEKAKRFSDWVTQEVIPSIRKNGMYVTQELLKDNKKANRILSRMILENNHYKEILSDIKPALELYDTFLNSNDLTSFTNTAKLLYVKRKNLIGYLRYKDKITKYNLATSEMINKKYMKNIKYICNDDSFKMQCMFTPSGLEWLDRYIIRNNNEFVEYCNKDNEEIIETFEYKLPTDILYRENSALNQLHRLKEFVIKNIRSVDLRDKYYQIEREFIDNARLRSAEEILSYKVRNKSNKVITLELVLIK